jgi:YcxB-like protein
MGKIANSVLFEAGLTAQEKQLNGQHMDINESGIVGQWADGKASYQFKWSAFERFIDLPDAILFLPNSVSFVRIPKDSLSSEDQQVIKRWGAPGTDKSSVD